MKVFIGGSRHIKQLNRMIKERLNNIINNKYTILLGDANGADKAVQSFLHEMQYNNVLVYCSGNNCRNNLGKWKVINVPTPSNLRGNKFYMVKDATMAKSADYGFMLWDGKSPGTLNNIFNLVIDKKKTLIYYSPEKKFFTISKLSDIEKLLIKCDTLDLIRFEKKINLSKLKNTLKKPEQLSLNKF